MSIYPKIPKPIKYYGYNVSAAGDAIEMQIKVR